MIAERMAGNHVLHGVNRILLILCCITIAAFCAVPVDSVQAAEKNLPIDGEVFELGGRTAFLILPKDTESNDPIPWVWYAPTLRGLPSRHERWMFKKLLDNGIAIAGVDVGESYGSPEGRAVYSALRKELVEKRGLARRPCLLARSRGGLMLYNWAAENPESVACIAGIYPVCNLSSYPGLARAGAAYGMTEQQLAAGLTDHNPIDRLAPLARAGVPILHIHGDRDRVVPLDENSGVVKERYDKLGGMMTLEIVEGQGHNLWSGWFENQDLVDFILRHARSEPIRARRLRCEYREAPLGIDHPAPRLSWTLESSVRGQRQTAYRVLVAGSIEALQANQGDLWDSGEVESNRNVNIVYAGRSLAAGQRCFWKVKVWDKDGNGSDWSDPSFWEMGLLRADNWKGQWINDGKPLPDKDSDFYRDDPAPLFRKEFELSVPVKRARLYISALGYVHARLNGQPVGDQNLDPLWTLPNKRVFYSVYDVTENLAQGENCLGVTLGNGWYNPLPLRMWGRVNLRQRLPVGRPQFIAQLAIEYVDGSRHLVVSDASWKTSPGPILRNSIYLGEKFDARKSVTGWDKPGLDDRAWESAQIAQSPEGRLQAQLLPPIKVTATIKPVGISEPSDGVYIVDMGQNFGGWASLIFDVPPGTEITMRYGELLYEDGTLNPMTSVCGQIKRKQPGKDGSPAVAWQSDTYIARGDGPETYTPRFTFHAFRYIEITGLPSRPSLDAIEGLRMNCAVEPVGSFSCSNGLFNRIQKMCQWTFLSNLFGVQSDCPHRERFGYGGDLVTTSDAFMLNYDMANFYAKAARDWHDSALPDGMLTDTAPSVGIQYCGVGWAMAHPHLLTQLYRYYGDRRIIEEQYPTSKRWLELVRARNADHIVRNGLHDHEALEKEKSPPMVTPLYGESARMLSRLARTLNKEEEADEYGQLAENIRKAYVDNYVDLQTGAVASGIQAAQAFALFLNMLPTDLRPQALAHLVSDITDRHGGHLTTGIFGTKYMLDVLSREGRADIVGNLVHLTDFPGWGYMLENGATTLWEHWEFSDNTFSHNHPMFGSVSQWFYNWLGGIEPNADAIGFDKFTLQPQFLETLDWVRCTHRSVRGPITCNWKRRGDSIALDIEIPVNTSATLVLPAKGVLTENGRPATDSNEVTQVYGPTGHTVLRLGSGRYQFEFTQQK